MKPKRAVLFIISWGVIIALFLVCLQAARDPRVKRLRDAFTDNLSALFKRLSDRGLAPRKRPMTTIELEEHLKANLPVPFTAFNREDWEFFWEILYGKVEINSGGWPRQQRQLSREEVEDMLVEYYQQPFSSFRQEQWNIFWQRILKGKVF